MAIAGILVLLCCVALQLTKAQECSEMLQSQVVSCSSQMAYSSGRPSTIPGFCSGSGTNCRQVFVTYMNVCPLGDRLNAVELYDELCGDDNGRCRSLISSNSVQSCLGMIVGNSDYVAFCASSCKQTLQNYYNTCPSSDTISLNRSLNLRCGNDGGRCYTLFSSDDVMSCSRALAVTSDYVGLCSGGCRQILENFTNICPNSIGAGSTRRTLDRVCGGDGAQCYEMSISNELSSCRLRLVTDYAAYCSSDCKRTEENYAETCPNSLGSDSIKTTISRRCGSNDCSNLLDSLNQCTEHEFGAGFDQVVNSVFCSSDCRQSAEAFVAKCGDASIGYQAQSKIDIGCESSIRRPNNGNAKLTSGVSFVVLVVTVAALLSKSS